MLEREVILESVDMALMFLNDNETINRLLDIKGMFENSFEPDFTLYLLEDFKEVVETEEDGEFFTREHLINLICAVKTYLKMKSAYYAL